jgi:hypothetical protein
MFGGWPKFASKKIKISNTAFIGVHWSQGGVSSVALFFLRSCVSWLELPCIEFLESRSLQGNVVEEGIYRKSPEILMIQKLREHIDRG